jgi:hypothetical protein
MRITKLHDSHEVSGTWFRARWWRLAALLLTALTMMGFMAVGRARIAGTPSAFGLLFTHPDGSPCAAPCLFGVRPGETPYDEAVARVQAHPLMDGLLIIRDPARNGILFGGESIGIGLVADSSGSLALIDVLLEPQAAFAGQVLPPNPLTGVTLAQIIAATGTPDFVEFTATGQGPMLQTFYQSQRLFAVTRRSTWHRLAPDDPLIYLFMTTQQASVRPGMYRWGGFTTFDRYFDSAFAYR